MLFGSRTISASLDAALVTASENGTLIAKRCYNISQAHFTMSTARDERTVLRPDLLLRRPRMIYYNMARATISMPYTCANIPCLDDKGNTYEWFAPRYPYIFENRCHDRYETASHWADPRLVSSRDACYSILVYRFPLRFNIFSGRFRCCVSTREVHRALELTACDTLSYAKKRIFSQPPDAFARKTRPAAAANLAESSLMAILDATNDGCIDCHASPRLLQRRLDSVSASTIVLSSIPFVLTWLVAVVVAQQKLFPALLNDKREKSGNGRDGLPWFRKESFKATTYRLKKPSAQRLASLVFSTSIGLSTVLVELLLCEIANTLHPAARAVALQVVLGSLLVLSVVITPALEIHGFAMATIGGSAETTSTRRTKPRMRYLLEASLMAAWLLVFWYMPKVSILRSSLHDPANHGHLESEHAFTEACLERIGIIGISLMASLSGFAAVSSLWQTFGVRHRHIRDTDIDRKEAGLAATEEMLAAKQSRLRALQRRMSETPSPTDHPKGFMGRVMGSLRGANAETHELRTLEMEISGLETMRYTLAATLSTLHARRTAQRRARTATGRLLHLSNTAFALYCAYRIVAGTYVVSAALLLRSSLPAEVRGVVSEALGAPLDARFVETWFEGWFLLAVGLTAAGILVGRKIGGAGVEEWDDCYEDEHDDGGGGKWR
nr:isoform 2 of golgi ph regulator [Quercus suber]